MAATVSDSRREAALQTPGAQPLKGVGQAGETRPRPHARKSYLRTVCENWVRLWPLYVQSAFSREAAEHGK